MMRHALFWQFRSLSPFRLFPLRSFSQSLLQVYLMKPGPDEEKVEFNVKQILDLVRTRSITSQNAVQRMTFLAKNKSEDERGTICMYLWEKSFEAARTSTNSRVAIVDFLSHLSRQSQEDFDDQPEGTASGPVMIQGMYGHKEQLWHEMPGMWYAMNIAKEIDDTPDDALDNRPDRKAEIDRILKDRHFISLLFLSNSTVLKDLSSELFWPFSMATEWPPFSPRQREEWEIWIPAIVVQMNTAGAELKEEILSIGPNERGWNSLGWWLRWQRRLLAMAADEKISAELRTTAKQAHDMMAIEQHLTNRWWCRWGHFSKKIAENEEKSSDERVTAKRTYDILAAEDARMRRNGRQQ